MPDPASAYSHVVPSADEADKQIIKSAHRVMQIFEFFARLYELPQGALVARALETAGLTARGDDPVATFSRGMRQRLALERALLHGPRLVLLDEPFTGLDDRSVAMVAERFRRLAAEGAIVILATHDLDVADGLITRMTP